MTTLTSCELDLHRTTKVVNRLHMTVLGKSCVVEIINFNVSSNGTNHSSYTIDLMHNDVTRLDARKECWS